MQRLKHWETRAFHEFLLSRAATPFKWGQNDCALFAADGIKAITGVDIAEDFRNKYTDESGAWAAIKNVCNGATVADAVVYCASKHGLTEWKSPLLAQRGDLVVFEAPTNSLVAGLVHLNGREVVAVGESGLFRFPIKSIKRAWHV